MITSVKYASATTYQITYDNDMKTSCGEHNREYQEILEWIEQGNTIDPQFTPEEIVANEASEIISSLWLKADSKQLPYKAVMSLIATGSAKSLPKSIEAELWIASIWKLYFVGKVSLMDQDFDVLGNAPHSVEDLMTEVYP